MRIEIKGRNTLVTDELRQQVERRFRKIGNQVAELAQLEVELREERNPAISESQIAEATLYLKGVTLRAKESSYEMPHAINECSDAMARQVKRHREKRRKRRDGRGEQVAAPMPPPEQGESGEDLGGGYPQAI